MHNKKTLLLFVGALTFLSGICSGETCFVSTDGSDRYPGTSPETAWRTITFAASKASPVTPGDTVYVKAGLYTGERIVFERSGTEGKPIRFVGYHERPDDNPTFKFRLGKPLSTSLMPLIDGRNRNKGVGMALHGIQYVQVENFQIQNYAVGLEARGESGHHIVLDQVIAFSLGRMDGSYSGIGIAFAYGHHNRLTR